MAALPPPVAACMSQPGFQQEVAVLQWKARHDPGMWTLLRRAAVAAAQATSADPQCDEVITTLAEDIIRRADADPSVFKLLQQAAQASRPAQVPQEHRSTAASAISRDESPPAADFIAHNSLMNANDMDLVLTEALGQSQATMQQLAVHHHAGVMERDTLSIASGSTEGPMPIIPIVNTDAPRPPSSSVALAPHADGPSPGHPVAPAACNPLAEMQVLSRTPMSGEDFALRLKHVLDRYRQSQGLAEQARQPAAAAAAAVAASAVPPPPSAQPPQPPLMQELPVAQAAPPTPIPAELAPLTATPSAASAPGAPHAVLPPQPQQQPPPPQQQPPQEQPQNPVEPARVTPALGDGVPPPAAAAQQAASADERLNLLKAAFNGGALSAKAFADAVGLLNRDLCAAAAVAAGGAPQQPPQPRALPPPPPPAAAATVAAPAAVPQMQPSSAAAAAGAAVAKESRNVSPLPQHTFDEGAPLLPPAPAPSVVVPTEKGVGAGAGVPQALRPPVAVPLPAQLPSETQGSAEETAVYVQSVPPPPPTSTDDTTTQQRRRLPSFAQHPAAVREAPKGDYTQQRYGREQKKRKKE